MKNIEFNNWSINNNKASISLLHLHAEFNVLTNDKSIYFQLIVTDSNVKTTTFNFYTLEDVISFTEDIVSKCMTNEEVTILYKQMLENGDFRLPCGLKTPKKGKITLTPFDVDEAITRYFGNGKNYRVSVREKLSTDFYGNSKILFYLIEHLEYNGFKKDIEYLLTDGDLKKALSNYADSYGYDLDNFQYIGDINKPGYYFGEDTLNYEGIELKVTHREKNEEDVKKLVKTKKELK